MRTQTSPWYAGDTFFQTLQDSFPVTWASLPLYRIPYCVVLASANHRSPASIADYLVVLVYIILHQASRILCCQERLWSSPETPANHAPVPGCYTGRSFSPLHQTMQFDEFISEDAEGISWHPYSLHTVYDNPQSRLAVIRARGVLYAFLLSCAVTFEWLWTRKIWIGICSYLWYLCMVSRSCSIAVDRIQN